MDRHSNNQLCMHLCSAELHDASILSFAMFKMRPTRQICTPSPVHRAGKTLRQRSKMQATESSALVESDMLNLAQHMANEASKITRPLFRAKVATDIKSDQTLVTEADRAAEMRMRQLVNERFPSHAVFGEEDGFEPGEGMHLSVSSPVRTYRNCHANLSHCMFLSAC